MRMSYEVFLESGLSVLKFSRYVSPCSADKESS